MNIINNRQFKQTNRPKEVSLQGRCSFVKITKSLLAPLVQRQVVLLNAFKGRSFDIHNYILLNFLNIISVRPQLVWTKTGIYHG